MALEHYKEISTSTFRKALWKEDASEDDPPVILFHGTADQIVNPEQSQELYDSLKKHNVVTELVTVSGGTHGGSEMYVSANLNKATTFLDKAREAKAAAAAVELPDTTTRDTSKTDSLTNNPTPKDTSNTAIVALRTHKQQAVSYSVYSLDGTLVSRSEQFNKQSLKPGVYYVVEKSANGSRKIFQIKRE